MLDCLVILELYPFDCKKHQQMSDWFHLPHLSVVRIEGEDARLFAHSQFTSAFNDAETGGWRLTAWCNPKGRVAAVILARPHENHVDLVIPAGQCATVASQLRLYAIGRKVSLSEGSGVCGCLAGGDPATQLAIDPGRRLDLERADSETSEALAHQWRLQDLRAGLAWLRPETSTRFLPQALGLEARGGLSYKKGCYPGQEIIARVHYLGKARDRLSAFRHAGTNVALDDRLLDANGNPVGSIVECLPDDGDMVGLAVVSSELPELAEVVRDGLPVQLLPPERL